MSPVDRPVRPEGDDTPPGPGDHVVHQDGRQGVIEAVDERGIATVATEIPARTERVLTHVGWLRAASAAPETSPDTATLYSAIEHAWRDDEDLMRPDNWDQMAAVAVQAVVAALAARAATPTETTEH